MGPAADEFAVHSRADDRDPGEPSHGGHHHRQSGDDGSKISAPAVRRGYRPLHDRGDRQARIHVPARGWHPRVSSSRIQPERQTRGRVSPAGDVAHATKIMRSLLFVPADGGRKLDKAMASGADAIIVDLEDSITPEGKASARRSAADFLKSAANLADRPRLLVRVNGLDTGLIDEDLDAIVASRPDAIMLPKAEGGPSVILADAKLAVREAIAGIPDGQIGIVAIATETAASLFAMGTYRGASARLTGITWGAEDLSADLGGDANRDATGRFLDPYRLARALCLAGAAAAQVQAYDTVTIDFRNSDALRREAQEAR